MANDYTQPVGTIVKVQKDGSGYKAILPSGELVTGIESYALKNAFRDRKALRLDRTKNGNLRWRKVPVSEWAAQSTANLNTILSKQNMTQQDFVDFLQSAVSLKPHELKMNELKWRYLVRTAVKGDNILLIGPSGCGKTRVVYDLSKALERPLFYFNMGATQDPRGALIGNTHYSTERGTYVAESEFIRAIQTPNAMILLDEFSRAHPDASNILMTVLDKMQGYLRVDEKPNSPVIKVAKGVSFFLTANVGSEYTGTRTMDRALYDRCKMILVEPLDTESEIELLIEMFPNVNPVAIKAIANIAGETRSEVKQAAPRISTIISTRVTIELADMINDGFTLEEAAEVAIYPFYSDDGGAESERSHVRKIVQKYLPTISAGRTPFQQTNDPATSRDNDELPW